MLTLRSLLITVALLFVRTSAPDLAEGARPVRSGAEAVAAARKSGSSTDGYSETSPHWPQIRTMVTDFRTQYQKPPQRAAEIAWAARHFDYVISGDQSAYKRVNPSVKCYRYAIFWSVMVPGPKITPSLASAYYDDMVAWFRAHPQYALEDAFLHQAQTTKAPDNRVVTKIWDSRRYMLNPGDPGLRAYQVDRMTRFAADADGVFLDEFGSGGIHGAMKGGVLEYPRLATYDHDLTTLLGAAKAALGGRALMINTSEYKYASDFEMILASGAAHLERMNNPLSSAMPERWRWIDSLLARNVLVELVTLDSWDDAKNPRGVFSTYTPGDYSSKSERLKMWELASYYMVVPAMPDHLLLDLQNAWTVPFSSVWLRAEEFDVGHPLGVRRLYRTGRDPVGNNYQVWARDFDHAVVLARPTAWWKDQTYGDTTAVSIPLPNGEALRLLHGDGALGPPVTSVTLRNAEAAILVK